MLIKFKLLPNQKPLPVFLRVNRPFSSKNPKPEEGKVDKHRHISENYLRFQRLMRWEVFPLLFLTASLIIYKQYKTRI